MAKKAKQVKAKAGHEDKVAPPNHVRAKAFNIVIRPEVHQKVMYWVDKCALEVSGFGKVVYHEGTDTFEVIEAYLLEQEVGPSHTDIEASALGKLMYQTHRQEGELKWWWHSHVNMSAFWSGTDVNTIKELGHQGWFTATVWNKKGEHRSALSYRTEHPALGTQGHMVDELPLKVGYALSPAVSEAWAEELATKVKERKAYFDAGEQLAWPEYTSRHTIPYGKDSWRGSTPLTAVKVGDADEWGLTKQEREEVWKEGMSGMGVASEAKYLGMTPMKWFDKFMSMGGAEYQEYEEKLLKALYAGELT